MLPSQPHETAPGSREPREEVNVNVLRGSVIGLAGAVGAGILVWPVAASAVSDEEFYKRDESTAELVAVDDDDNDDTNDPATGTDTRNTQNTQNTQTGVSRVGDDNTRDNTRDNTAASPRA
jgi:hypothetical protein